MIRKRKLRSRNKRWTKKEMEKRGQKEQKREKKKCS